MAKVMVNDSTLTAIADAIREKTGGTDTMKPGDMAGQIEEIPTGITIDAIKTINVKSYSDVQSGNVVYISNSSATIGNDNINRISIEDTVSSISFTPDDGLCAICFSGSPYIKIYDSSSPIWIQKTDTGVDILNEIESASFSPDGKIFAVLSKNSSSEPELYLYNTQTTPWTKLENPSTLPQGWPFNIAFDRTGNICGVASRTSKITLYNTQTTPWTKLDIISEPPTDDGHIYFSPVSDICVYAQSDWYGKLLIYNTSTESWTKDRTISTGNGCKIGSASFNKDGTLFVTCHNNSPYISIYGTSDWSKKDNPQTIPTNVVYSVDFNNSGTILAVGTYNSPYYIFYDTSTTPWNNIVTSFEIPSYCVVYVVTFSHSGKKCIFGSNNNTVTIANTNQELFAQKTSSIVTNATQYGIAKNDAAVGEDVEVDIILDN